MYSTRRCVKQAAHATLLLFSCLAAAPGRGGEEGGGPCVPALAVPVCAKAAQASLRCAGGGFSRDRPRPCHEFGGGPTGTDSRCKGGKEVGWWCGPRRLGGKVGKAWRLLTAGRPSEARRDGDGPSWSLT